MYRRILTNANANAKSRAVGYILTRNSELLLRPHLLSQLRLPTSINSGSSSSSNLRSLSTTRFLLQDDASKTKTNTNTNTDSPQPQPQPQTKPTMTNTQEWGLIILSGLLGGMILQMIVDYYEIGPKSKRKSSKDNKVLKNKDEEWEPKYGSPNDFELAIQELRTLFDQDDNLVTTDKDILHDHGFSTFAYHDGMTHSVVVFPRSTEDVVKIVKVATKYRMPIIPYSGATNLEGHTSGHAVGGICVDLSNMDLIIEIHEADSDLVCQPGARWVDVNETLKEKGIPLFFPLDPAPGATIGGMLSTGCSGTNAVRYGTAKAEWFLNATVVLPSGEVIKTRRRSRKSSAGFDTTKLFIGAEGTLGIVTEVTIRLAPVLPTTVALAHFPNVKKATEAVVEILNQGVGIQCVELLDDVFISALNKHGHSGRVYEPADHLFFKFQGPTESSLKETASIVQKIVKKHEGKGFELARSEEEAEDMWNERKNAHFAGLAMKPGAKGWPTDVCVPISKLPDLVYETKQDILQTGLLSPIVGHVGDGNFHAQILFSSDEEYEIAKRVVHRMVKRAISMDGTCTGEHGVGIGKKEYLRDELGDGTVELMRLIKRNVDPLGLFNPGKLYPDPKSKQVKEEEENSS